MELESLSPSRELLEPERSEPVLIPAIFQHTHVKILDPTGPYELNHLIIDLMAGEENPTHAYAFFA